MIIDVSDVISNDNKTCSCQGQIDFESFDAGLGEFPVRKVQPFLLTISNVEGQKLEIEAETQVIIGIPCDRCLKEVSVSFPIIISHEIDLEKLAAKDLQELEEHSYMTEEGLDVDQLIFGEILVSWPDKVLCKEDCKGICRNCGADLNLTECGCQKTEPDPRMAAIQDIFNQFKEV